MAHRLKHLPPMWETQVRSVGREDPLEKEMAPHSSTLAWKIPWMEEPGGLQSMGCPLVHGKNTGVGCHVLSPVLDLSALKSSDVYLLEATEWPKGSQASC